MKWGKMRTAPATEFPIAMLVPTSTGDTVRWDGVALIDAFTFRATFNNCPVTPPSNAAWTCELIFGGNVLNFSMTLHMGPITAGDTLSVTDLTLSAVQASTLPVYSCMWCGVGPFPSVKAMEDHEEACHG